MRKFAIILAGLGVVSTGVGCNHTAGKCDCMPLVCPCVKYGLYTPESSAVQEAPKGEMLPAAPIKKDVAK